MISVRYNTSLLQSITINIFLSFGESRKEMSDFAISRQTVSKILFFVFLLVILVFSLSPSESLALGLFIGILFNNPFPKQSRSVTKYLLQISVIGLGFGMNFQKVMEAGKDGFIFTTLTIAAAMGI